MFLVDNLRKFPKKIAKCHDLVLNSEKNLTVSKFSEKYGKSPNCTCDTVTPIQ